MKPRGQPLGFIGAAGWTLALRAAGLPMQIGVFLLLARLLPLAEVGLFAVANGLWQLARGLGPLGTDQAAMRFLPALLAAGRPGAAAEFTRLAHRSVRLLGLVSALALVVLGLALIGLGGIAASPAQVLLAALALPAFALTGLQIAVLRGHQRVRVAQFHDSLVLYPVAAVLIGGGWLAGHVSLDWALAAHGIAVWLVAGLYALASKRLNAAPPTALDAAERREMTRATVRIFAAFAVTALTIRLPALVAFALLGAAPTALYESAQRMAWLGTLATWAAGMAVSPLFAAAHAEADRPRLQRLLAQASLAAAVPGLVWWLALIGGGGWLLGWFGPAYPAAWPALAALGGAVAVNAAFGMTSTFYYMSGRERLVLRYSLYSLAATVLGGAALALPYGILGLALGVLAGALLRDLGLTLTLRRETGLGLFRAARP